MTTTPIIWKDSESVYAGSSANVEYDASAISLEDGRILNVWIEKPYYEDNPLQGTMMAQMFDAEGNKLGGPYQLSLNTTRGAQTQPELVAMADGGYVVSYIDASDHNSIRYDRFDSGGNYVEGGVIAGGTGNPFVRFPNIAVLPNGDFVVSYQQINSDSSYDVLARLVNGTTNEIGPAITEVQDNQDLYRMDTVVLSNGTIVTNYEKYQSEGSFPSNAVTGVDSTGALKFSFQTTATGETGSFPHIAALTGGGFVTVWNDTKGSDIRAAIYDNNGAVTKSNFAIKVDADRVGIPDVVALQDGGFYVAWYNTATIGHGIQGARYSASGQMIGSVNQITNIQEDVHLALTTDGRIVVTAEENGPDIFQIILDPRDKTINGTIGSDVITSRIDGATVFGFEGQDTLLGGAGDDTLIGGAGIDSVQGGDGNDLIRGSQGEIGDNVDGGGGKDLLDLSGLTTNAVNVNLQTGIWSTSVTATTLAIINVEDVYGGTGSDKITGDDGHSNKLDGGAGDDLLDGKGGNDTLIGGAGNDTLFGGSGNDTFVLSDGHDQVVETSGIDTITSIISRSLHDYAGVENLTLLGNGRLTGRGTNSSNVIKGNDRDNRLYGEGGHDKLYGYGGNDTLDGGTNSDTMYGGTGNDTYIVNSTSDKLSEGSGGGTDVVKSSVTWKLATGFENLTLTGASKINGTGTSHNNIITGNSAHNVLTGGGGNDTFVFNATLVASHYDTITDFDHATDRFEIDNSVFKGLKTGVLSSSDFKLIVSGVSTAGVDNSDRILYDKNHGNLYFDRDGSRTDYDRVLFAHVDHGRLITNTDFLVI